MGVISDLTKKPEAEHALFQKLEEHMKDKIVIFTTDAPWKYCGKHHSYYPEELPKEILRKIGAGAPIFFMNQRDAY